MKIQTFSFGRGFSEVTVDEAAIAAFLTDPRFDADGTDYPKLAAEHGLDGKWEALTLGTPRMLVWSESRGFVTTDDAEKLIARFAA